MSTEQRQNPRRNPAGSSKPSPPTATSTSSGDSLRELISAQPLPADVTVTAGSLGGVPTAEITVDLNRTLAMVVLYFHGGVYVIGDAFLAANLASQAGRMDSAARSSPSTTGSPPSTRIRQRPTNALAAYEALPAGRHSPIGHRLRGRARLARRVPRHRYPGQRPRSRAAPARRGLRHVKRKRGTSPWPGRPWKPSATPTRCSARRHSAPESPTTRQGTDAALGLISPIFADLSSLCRP